MAERKTPDAATLRAEYLRGVNEGKAEFRAKLEEARAEVARLEDMQERVQRLMSMLLSMAAVIAAELGVDYDG